MTDEECSLLPEQKKWRGLTERVRTDVWAPSDRDDDLATDVSGVEPADRIGHLCERVRLFDARRNVPGCGELGEAFEAGVALLVQHRHQALRDEK